jgi:hypothetical protein
MANLSNINNKFIVESDGDVGIGVTTALDKLNVGDGNIRISQVGNVASQLILNTYQSALGNTTYKWFVGQTTSANSYSFQIGNGTTPYLHINSLLFGAAAGNVGIGTTTVNSKLEIYSTATFDPRTSGINIHRPGSFGQYGSIAYNVNETVISSTYTGTGATDYGAIKFQQFNNGTVPRVVMFLNTVGNVGIGTVTPGTKLEIKNPDTSGSAARTVVTRQLTLNANGGNNLQPYEGFGTGIIFEGYDYAGGGGTSGPRDYAYIDSIIENSGSTPVDFRSQLKFYTNPGGSNTQAPTPKMVIEGGGYVGIGTTSPSTNLHINNDASNSYATLRLEGSNRGGIIEMYNQASYPVSSWTTDQSGNMSFATSGAFAGTSLSTKFSIATNGATTQTMDSTTSLNHLWSQGVPLQNTWYTVYTYSLYDSVCFFAMVSFENDAGDGANQSAMFATSAGPAYGGAFGVEQISGGTGIEARRSSTSFQVRQTIGAYTSATRLNVRFVSIN